MNSSTLQVVDAHRTMGGTKILNGVDLSMSQGEIVGLIGPNGSGKSSLLKAIIGALPGTQSTVLIDGEPVSRLRRAQTLAFVEQQAPEIDLIVSDIVALGRTPHQRRFAGQSALDQHLVYEALRRTGSLMLRHRRYPTLSGGERQRVLIARALAQNAPFLLLDEPTNHLDLASQVAVLTLLDEVAATGTGILLAMHDLTHAAALCDWVIMLNHGAVDTRGHPPEVLTHDRIAAVFGVQTRQLVDPITDAIITTLPAVRRRVLLTSGPETAMRS